MFDGFTDDEVRDMMTERTELIAPVPAELAPPIESVDSVELGWPWKLGAVALLIGAFATVGFLLYG